MKKIRFYLTTDAKGVVEDEERDGRRCQFLMHNATLGRIAALRNNPSVGKFGRRIKQERRGIGLCISLDHAHQLQREPRTQNEERVNDHRSIQPESCRSIAGVYKCCAINS